MQWWERAREEFPITKEMIFMDISLGCSMPQRVMDRVLEFYRTVQMKGPSRDHWLDIVASTRSKVAKLIGATPSEIAFTKNTSDGINMVINGIGLQPEDNLIINNLEHPSNREPWLNQRSAGVEVRVARSRDGWLHPEDVFALVDSHTRAVGLSHVEYNSGVRNDIAAYAAFCNERKILLVVDGIQSAGVLECDVGKSAIPVLAVGGHKALLGPHGCGFLFCSKVVIERISPVYAGMSPAFTASWDDDQGATFSVDAQDARKFEYGNLNAAGIAALDTSIEFILELGVANIEARVLELTGRLHDGLVDVGAEVSSPREDARRGGIVIVQGPNPEGLFTFLNRNKVRASLMSAGMLRFSPHFYNTMEEVDRVVGLVGDFIRSE